MEASYFENVAIAVWLILASLHFVKSTSARLKRVSASQLHQVDFGSQLLRARHHRGQADQILHFVKSTSVVGESQNSGTWSSALTQTTFHRSTECATSSARAGCGTSDSLHGVRGLRLLDGVFRRERRRKGAAGALTLTRLWTTTVSTSTRTATFEQSGTVGHGASRGPGGILSTRTVLWGRRGAGSRTPGS